MHRKAHLIILRLPLQGTRKLSPFFVPYVLPSFAASQIAQVFSLMGPCHTVSTACTTGANAIADAFAFIKDGHAQAMIAGASEACLTPLAFAGFLQ